MQVAGSVSGIPVALPPGPLLCGRGLRVSPLAVARVGVVRYVEDTLAAAVCLPLHLPRIPSLTTDAISTATGCTTLNGLSTIMATMGITGARWVNLQVRAGLLNRSHSTSTHLSVYTVGSRVSVSLTGRYDHDERT